MTDHDQQYIEAILAKYRPGEAPAELLDRVERAALEHRPRRSQRFAAAMAIAAEMLLSLCARGLITATTFIVLLLLAAGGY